MSRQKLKNKTKEWARRYIPAEVLGTLGALVAAWVIYNNTHSYIASAASGWIGEGIGFYGYFVATELLLNAKKYRGYAIIKRIPTVIGVASTSLVVEFAPAEVLDNFLIRPFAMFIAPQYIHPYPIGFLAGKFSADVLFYSLAIVGYEARKHWLS